ncbi:Dicer-like protein 2 [Kalmusia sp. IMI 367209]|nr:Dicer-like protein 2 [Kalmusia sp. IMI 367209]
MISIKDTDKDDSADTRANFKDKGFRLRAYQTEMLEESMKANIIVVQDTGSGKTHVALARTAAELEICAPSKFIWFLAPTVALCEQQTKVFQSNLPGYGIQSLSGRDGVDNWTDQNTWDAVLDNVRIVLSTHQVLLDALTHGFIKMSQLALIIFDEGPKPPDIEVQQELTLPSTSEIEKNMCAITKTPKMHRRLPRFLKTPSITLIGLTGSELLKFVHRPKLLLVDYPLPMSDISPLYTILKSELINYDMTKDPYVMDLVARPSVHRNVSKKLEEVYTKHSTHCYQQLKLLFNKYEATAAELGISVADWYLEQTIHQFRNMVSDLGHELHKKTNLSTLKAQTSEHLLEWSRTEKQHLLRILNRLPLPRASSSHPMALDNLSPKVEILLDTLATEAAPNLKGLIFVEQRVWVAALAEIFALHPKVRGKFSLGTFVGGSQSSRRATTMAALIEPRNKQATLDKFRDGETNLIITTSVLEEGIDVSECHLVICFESPKNLKSFVQRRGRARRQESKYFIFSPHSGNQRSSATWELLEEEMKAAYENDLRHIREAEEKESMNEHGERFYEVGSTRALLTFDSALRHLHHFCALLASGPYIDTRPQFRLEEQNGYTAAEVTLPLSVDPSLRVTRSLELWRTEHMAIKDAAFESYKMLHQNGLVNDNLLPVKPEDDVQVADFQILDNTPSLVEVNLAMDMWPTIARCQEQAPHSYHRTVLEFQGIANEPFYLTFHLPVQLPVVPDFTLFWNHSKNILVKNHQLPELSFSNEEVQTMREITRKILISIHGGRMQDMREDFLWFLVPSDRSGFPWTHDMLLEWNARTTGLRSAAELIRQGQIDLQAWGNIALQDDMRKWFPKTVNANPLDDSPSQEYSVQVTRIPKRRGFLHPVPVIHNENPAYTRTEEFPASQCLVDNLPSIYSVCALLIPSILYRYETYLTTNELRVGLLAPLSFKSENLPLLVQALTCSSTEEPADYQRLEFLGDCILKFIAFVHLMADHPKWPESYLTMKKNKIVSNGYAARAALSAGLDKHILRKKFTGAKWKPRYANEALSAPPTEEKTEISSKTLADVIESLIGASYMIGGFPKAFVCIQTLLPSEKWTAIPDSNKILYDAVPVDVDINSLTPVETLVGYTFQKKAALLEALTHASYTGPLVNCSYERFEFLGDAILDYIISRRLYAHTPEISHQKMHGIRAAVVNAAFLAFRMFETKITEEHMVLPELRKELVERCLWQYLRSGHTQLVGGRDAAIKQYDGARVRINEALEYDGVFPWHLLALMDAPKFLSDIVESVIGAIYIDSHGDIAACEVFVRRLGILDCLERILRDGVDCLHPKERLGLLAVDKEVQYVGVVEEGEVMQGHLVQVKVGGKNVGGVVGGVKRLNAETIAAWEAVRILEGSGSVIVDGDVEMEDANNEEEEDDDDEWFDAEEGGGVELNQT